MGIDGHHPGSDEPGTDDDEHGEDDAEEDAQQDQSCTLLALIYVEERVEQAGS